MPDEVAKKTDSDKAVKNSDIDETTTETDADETAQESGSDETAVDADNDIDDAAKDAGETAKDADNDTDETATDADNDTDETADDADNEKNESADTTHKKVSKRRVVSITLLVIVILLALILGIVTYQFQSIRTFQFAKVAEPGDTWLIMGSDNREEARTDQLGILSVGNQGQRERADIIFLARREGDKLIVLSVPRDVVVDYNGHKEPLYVMLTLGESYMNYGLCDAMKTAADHAVMVSMNAVGDMSNVLGGVSVHADYDTRDAFTGLKLHKGDNHLDDKQTVAFIRSRYPEVLVDGKWVRAETDPGARQRVASANEVATQFRDKMKSTYNPITWLRLLGIVSREARIDEDTSLSELRHLLGGKLEMHTLDTEVFSPKDMRRNITQKGYQQIKDLGFYRECSVPSGYMNPPKGASVVKEKK